MLVTVCPLGVAGPMQGKLNKPLHPCCKLHTIYRQVSSGTIFFSFAKKWFMISNDEKNSQDNIPRYNPSKAMDSKREVAQSPDEKTDQDFPGYPHYPAKEDIMNQSTGAHRVDAETEDYGTGPNQTNVNQRFVAGKGNDRSQAVDNNNEYERSLEATNTTNEEIGVPQNVTNQELDKDKNIPGTDMSEAVNKDEGR